MFILTVFHTFSHSTPYSPEAEFKMPLLTFQFAEFCLVIKVLTPD